MNFIPQIPLMGLIGGIAGPLTRSMAARVVVLGYLGSRLVTWIQQDPKKETRTFLPSVCCKMWKESARSSNF